MEEREKQVGTVQSLNVPNNPGVGKVSRERDPR